MVNGPAQASSEHVVVEVGQDGVGRITLNRPQALNALSLSMVRALSHTLRQWADNPAVRQVVIRGSHKQGPFGHFCAGGDIRYFHQAARAGDASLEDFFTEEYQVNHLIHVYPKPYVALMDGVVMGGGMGLSQGAACRVVTPSTRMAMPEARIGLFPDVGGGYFLSRCPGHVGEWLAITGQVLHAGDAVAFGLADGCVPTDALPTIWQSPDPLQAAREAAQPAATQWHAAVDAIDAVFGLPSLPQALHALAQVEGAWASAAREAIAGHSPLMCHVIWTQIRRARGMPLADVLRMERDMVRHCFHWRGVAASETLEGVRALAVDKDHAPRWQPAAMAEVLAQDVAGFFVSPWPAYAHPLRDLAYLRV